MVLSHDTSRPKNFPADCPRESSCTVQRFLRLTQRRRQLAPRRRTLERRDLQYTLRTVSRLSLCDAVETKYLQEDGVLLKENYLEIEIPQAEKTLDLKHPS